MREVEIQNEEPVSIREYNYRLAKITDSNYAKVYLEQVTANTTQLNVEERTQLLRLLQYFDYLFDGDLGEWDT